MHSRSQNARVWLWVRYFGFGFHVLRIIMAYSLPVKDALPNSFRHEFIHSKCTTDEVFLRASIQRESEIKDWIMEFSRKSRTQWNLRTSKPSGAYVICMYVSRHRSMIFLLNVRVFLSNEVLWNFLYTHQNSNKVVDLFRVGRNLYATIRLSWKLNAVRIRKVFPRMPNAMHPSRYQSRFIPREWKPRKIHTWR